jgi:hypothetical protein
MNLKSSRSSVCNLSLAHTPPAFERDFIIVVLYDVISPCNSDNRNVDFAQVSINQYVLAVSRTAFNTCSTQRFETCMEINPFKTLLWA